MPPETGKGRPVYEFADQSIWKARFAPSELGHLAVSLRVHQRERADGRRAKASFGGRRADRNPGFLRQHPDNPFRWVHHDGSPFYGVGLQECLGDAAGTGSALAAMSIEGPFRTDRTDLLELLPGPLYVRGPP